jgi:hypothetical protein
LRQLYFVLQLVLLNQAPVLDAMNLHSLGYSLPSPGGWLSKI